MRLRSNFIFQAAMVAGTVALSTQHILPPEAQPWAAVVLTTAQAILSLRAQFSNPDGTPARVAWEPDARTSDTIARQR